MRMRQTTTSVQQNVNTIEEAIPWSSLGLKKNHKKMVNTTMANCQKLLRVILKRSTSDVTKCSSTDVGNAVFLIALSARVYLHIPSDQVTTLHT